MMILRPPGKRRAVVATPGKARPRVGRWKIPGRSAVCRWWRTGERISLSNHMALKPYDPIPRARVCLPGARPYGGGLRCTSQAHWRMHVGCLVSRGRTSQRQARPERTRHNRLHPL